MVWWRENWEAKKKKVLSSRQLHMHRVFYLVANSPPVHIFWGIRRLVERLTAPQRARVLPVPQTTTKNRVRSIIRAQRARTIDEPGQFGGVLAGGSKTTCGRRPDGWSAGLVYGSETWVQATLITSSLGVWRRFAKDEGFKEIGVRGGGGGEERRGGRCSCDWCGAGI